MKKGIIEIQFNWIFILIVGAIILSFFVGIVMKQKDVSLKKSNVQLSYDLETITTGAEVSKGTSQTIEVPNLGIDFSSKDCVRKYSIGGGTKLYKGKIIFAPSRIEGSALIAWTLDWSVPYRITNFLFLTSPTLRYIFVADVDNPNDPGRELTLKVNKTFPDTLYKEIIRPSDIETTPNYKNYKVRLIYFSSEPLSVPNQLTAMRDRDVSALWVKNVLSPFQKGKLSFYKKAGKNFVWVGDTYVLGLPSLYGAIFTDDYEMYNCNMKEAFRKMYFVTRIMQNRTYMLYNEGSLGANCQTYYHSSLDSLKLIQQNASVLYSDFQQADSQQDIEYIYNLAYDQNTGLQLRNGNLQLQSCPEMY